jgi:hypothetical protein
MVHHFDVDVAVAHGVNAAVIYSNILHWVEKNRANNKHLVDGSYWTYNSYKAFAILFPYLSEKQIRTAIDRLVDNGLIIKDSFNSDNRDNTNWYTIGQPACPTGQAKIMADAPAHEGNRLAPQGGPLPYINNHIVNADEKGFVSPSSPYVEEERNEVSPGSSPAGTKNPKKTANKKTSPRSAPPPSKEETLYQKLMETYYEWFKAKTGGIPPKIDGQEGKALKALEKYFKGLVFDKFKTQGKEPTGVEVIDEAVKIFNFILTHWNKLSNFIQEGTKLSQINSNISNIIMQFKDGHKQRNKTGQPDTRTNEERLGDLDAEVKRFLYGEGHASNQRSSATVPGSGNGPF